MTAVLIRVGACDAHAQMASSRAFATSASTLGGETNTSATATPAQTRAILPANVRGAGKSRQASLAAVLAGALALSLLLNCYLLGFLAA
jgi:hypothetical protein